MKISKISFKNIHSLRGEHHIDFLSGPLAESGLFAITGATGSGKSTLLDVITLALYNKIPRMEGSISKSVIDGEGGIMTRNAQDCYAEVEYIVNGKTYRSHWSIERNRNNNLNDRKQEITDVATGTIIESGKSSVPSKNEALIGLSYDQFVKAMVLSQGEFSKLLKAPRDQRNKLLEDITGAKDYRAIGSAVFKKYRAAAKVREELTIRLEEVELLNEEQKKNLITEESTLNVNKLSQKKSLDDLKFEIENQKGILKNQKLLATNDISQKQLSEDLEKFKNEERLLEKHAKYAIHSPLIVNSEQQDKELRIASEELQKQEIKADEALKSKNNLLQEASVLMGRNIEAAAYNSELGELRKKVLALKNEEDLAENQVKLHEEHVKTALVDVNRKTNRLEFNANPTLFMNSLSVVEARVVAFLKSKTSDGDTDLSVKEQQLNDNLEIVNKLKILLIEYHAELKTKISKETELKASTGAQEKYNASLKLLESELKSLEVEVEKLTKEEEERKKHQSLEAHRNALMEGEACPLCGALEHPFALAHPIHNLQEAVLKTKKEILNTKHALRTATLTNLENEQKNSKSLSEAIRVITEALKPHWDTIEKTCASLQVATMLTIDEVNALGLKFTEELKVVNQVKEAQNLRELLITINKTTAQWSQSADLRIAKETERKKLYPNNDIEDKVQRLMTKWTATNENSVHIQQSITNFKLRIKEITEARENFYKQLQIILDKEQIASVSQLKGFILSETAAEAIRRKKQQLQLKQARLHTEKNTAIKEMAQFVKLVTTTSPVAELEAKFKVLEDAFAQLNETIGRLKAQLEADKNAKEKQDKFLNELKGLKKEESLWKTMNDLIGDATGKKFSNFVQDLTLEQLIGYTNLRLKDLSDRYILDIPTAEEGDKNDSLKVFDCHQGDARRSINTLSGGETFMVSLAMAFALSDLAAKNVKIESIFIDEGFGTLDPETLNQAITILEKMQNEGDKSIGVISHVEALKERISTQIRLEKTGSGYSTIEIV